jgi:site-specific DNA recombinase
LTNVAYAGKVRYKDEVHDGEQPALIDPDTFQRVQALLRCHGPEVGAPGRHQFSSLLKGLLRCVPCDCAMTPAHTARKGHQRYRYYTCVNAQKRGWQTCPSKSIPAAPLERLVVEQIQRLGRDPQVLRDVLGTGGGPVLGPPGILLESECMSDLGADPTGLQPRQAACRQDEDLEPAP